MNFDDHPRLLPAGHRIRRVFFWRPIEVAGRRRRMEWVNIVQRWHVWTSAGGCYRSMEWVDVGYLDEVLPALKTPEAREC